MNSFAKLEQDNRRSATARNAYNGSGNVSQAVSQLIANRPEANAYRELDLSLNQSPRIESQLQTQSLFNRSPRVVAQAKLAQALSQHRSFQQSEQTVQRQEALEENRTETLPDEVSLADVEALEEEEEPLQGKFAPIQKEAAPEARQPLHRGVESVPNQQHKTGLPFGLKTRAENLSGMSMDDVEVEYNSSKPAQMSALAITQGKNIHLGPGQEQHLPHETWHVVQQKQGKVKPTIQMKGIAVNDDPALENEADEMGQRLEAQKATQSDQQASPGIRPLANVLQAKWIADKRSPFLIWDRQLDGLRWYYLIKEDKYFFIIEETDLQGRFGALEGPGQARTMSEWANVEGFVKGNWKESDSEVVPFEAYEGEKVKLANLDVEIPRVELEQAAIGFVKGGEAGNEKEIFPMFEKYLLLLRKDVIPAIEASTKKLPSNSVLEKVGHVWALINKLPETEEQPKIEKEQKLNKDEKSNIKIEEKPKIEIEEKPKIEVEEKPKIAVEQQPNIKITPRQTKKTSVKREARAQIKKEWKDAMEKLKKIMSGDILILLKGIRELYGETAYVESLNATTNLMKRFLNPSSESYKTHPLVKAFEVYNQLLQRTAQLRFRKDEPIKVDYKEPEFAPLEKQMQSITLIQLGTRMADVEVDFDVLARRTGANKDPSIKHVHEVDLAFVKVFKGVTEAYANPSETGLSFQGGGGVGEKVFAFGHQGAIDFRKEIKKTEERFYALVFPKGFVKYFGFDLSKLGGKGASVREPNEEQFSRHLIPQLDKDPEIKIPTDKMFFIRAETSTPQGQVDIHFGWRDMIVNAHKINYVDFFRQYALAVIEFTKSGTIIKIQLLKETK